ncbi:MAG: hypothetical protein HQK76_06445 [Desulfobacterales bacterium]|nr:hypothetical protein [Desulfobacterales bacterium]
MENFDKIQLDALVELQESETEIAGINTFLLDVPNKIEAIDKKLKDFEAEVAKKTDELNDIKKRYRTLESDEKINLDKIRKCHEKLSSLKTNKEYQIVLKEIEDIKEKNSAIMDEMISLLDVTEESKKELGITKEKYSNLVKEVTNEKQAIEKDAELKKSVLKEKESSLGAIKSRISKELLRRYNFIVERGKGVAVAKVIDSVCYGCNLNIPPQLYNELFNCKSIKTCPFCHRIIYKPQNNLKPLDETFD